MNLTEGTTEEKQGRAKKMMLWFGIVSLLMTFAGWTSAYIVSSTREDWLIDFQLPSSFYMSTTLIVISSLTYILAKKAMKDGKSSLCTTFLIITLGLGIAFIVFQSFNFNKSLIPSATFWHFLDLLWVYLILFFYLYR